MPKPSPPEKNAPEFRLSRRLLLVVILLAMPLVIGGLVFADWYRTIPADAKATYVGRQSCIKCHQQEHDDWHGSHHDLAMDVATSETVLGDFDDAELEHYGVTSRMFRRDGKYFVHTEGEKGKFNDYEVKWVFGVEPMQQYLVELDRPVDAQEHEIGRVQVLPVTWDTQRKEWFVVDPPNVHEKLEPGDRLHWTGAAQNWNRQCADCHSTNLERKFDAEKVEYHTTFSEIDVSCEACHGPGSLHVELAERASLFWDRERGYALAKLKGKDHTTQVDTCARCHVRRERTVAPDCQGGEPLYEHFCNALIREGLYHADGQIRDEVYVHGSFIQSKMYHKGVRCSDCHDPHSLQVKFTDNQLCTTCHLAEAHTAGKFDTPAHHHHKVDSAGSLCIECHMPETAYMEIDPRRDHSLRVPRPDLSVELGTPNACTGCHLDAARLSDKAREAFTISHTRDPLEDYASWLRVAEEAEDEAVRKEVQAEIDRVNQWAQEHTTKWYGEKKDEKPHFAHALTSAWRGLPEAEEQLRAVVEDQELSAMARASALAHLAAIQNETTAKVVERALADDEPLVRFAALSFFDNQIETLAREIRDAELETELAERDAAEMQRAVSTMEFDNPQTKGFMQQRIQQIRGRADFARQQAAQAAAHMERAAGPPAELLADPVRLVRAEAGRILAPVDGRLLDGPQRQAREAAIKEYVAGLMVENDVALAQRSLGALYESMADKPSEFEQAVETYRTAIRVEPSVAGPRTSLAELLERLASKETDASKAQQLVLDARELRREELPLWERDAGLFPNDPQMQLFYANALATLDEDEQALQVLSRARQIAPQWIQPVVQMIVILHKRQQWDASVALARQFAEDNPDDQMAQVILEEVQNVAAAARRRQGPPNRPQSPE